jgi:hypothetical protein
MADAPPAAAPAWSRLLRPARWLLYPLLAGSALVTLAGGPTLEQAVREGRLSHAALIAAPILFLVFIVVFAAYRFALVRAGRYLAGKAFVQVGLMVLVLTLVLPGSMERYRAAGTVRAVDLGRFLAAADAESRAMAAELARHRDRAEAMRYVPRLVDLLEDGSPEVRRQARASLASLAGNDVGGEGPEAPARWRAWWQANAQRIR